MKMNADRRDFLDDRDEPWASEEYNCNIYRGGGGGDNDTQNNPCFRFQIVVKKHYT